MRKVIVIELLLGAILIYEKSIANSLDQYFK